MAHTILLQFCGADSGSGESEDEKDKVFNAPFPSTWDFPGQLSNMVVPVACQLCETYKINSGPTVVCQKNAVKSNRNCYTFLINLTI